MIPESSIYLNKRNNKHPPPPLYGTFVQFARLVRVVKLVSWHISHHYPYELHHLNVIFTTYTCGVYWTRENSHIYFSSSGYPFWVVSIEWPVKTIAFSSHIILILRVLGLPIFTKKPSSLILVTKMEFAQIQETCQAEGYPPPKLTWIRLVIPLPAGKSEVREGKLTIRNLRPVDSGLYQCVATNSLGSEKATMNLVVTAGLYIARYADLIYHGQ